MSAAVMIITVFLTNGQPIVEKFHVPDAEAICNAHGVAALARAHVAPYIPIGLALQDPLRFHKFICLDMPAPIAPGVPDPGASAAEPEPEPEGEALAPKRGAAVSNSLGRYASLYRRFTGQQLADF